MSGSYDQETAEIGNLLELAYSSSVLIASSFLLAFVVQLNSWLAAWLNGVPELFKS